MPTGELDFAKIRICGDPGGGRRMLCCRTFSLCWKGRRAPGRRTRKEQNGRVARSTAVVNLGARVQAGAERAGETRVIEREDRN